mgnify:CR=1 FL=1
MVLDAERCINCTRCTRFTEEVSGSNQLTIIQRGPHNYPMTAPGELFDEPYSMNVTDLCPVGALTEDYFRFKARVWEMSKTPTVSDFGARGTNVDVWVRDNQVLRITPQERKALSFGGHSSSAQSRMAVTRRRRSTFRSRSRAACSASTGASARASGASITS